MCPDEVCQRIAASQRGLISLSQALAAGISRRQVRWRLDSERWGRVLPGVYTVSGSDDPWLQMLEAARLWTGDAIVTGISSGALWGFDGIAPEVVEITTATRKRHPEIIVHHNAGYDAEDLIRHRGLPTTTPTRTLIDISGVVTEAQLALALDSALRRGLTFTPLIRTRLEALGTKGRRGMVTPQDLPRQVAALLGQARLMLEA